MNSAKWFAYQPSGFGLVTLPARIGVPAAVVCPPAGPLKDGAALIWGINFRSEDVGAGTQASDMAVSSRLPRNRATKRFASGTTRLTADKAR